YPTLTQTEIRNALAAFLFRGEDVFRPVGLLSGGERARVLLLKLMLARDNLLLLDEPTNHLDIASREALEEALSGYDGTMLIVSHDRYFINRMASRVLRLTESGCASFPGNYDNYAEKFREVPADRPTPTTPAKVNDYRLRKEQESEKRKLLTRLRRCEEAVAAAEEKIATLETALADDSVAADYARVTELSAALDETNRELEEQMTLWEALQTQAEEAGLV
ncbi:MAG: ABC-F family ATP-binding cassette domain-containing protein, partial [Clostridia bacterium]|nr:ABC-F family ATP-binding cassette domain-containing protein [Clostridia bacterium]